MTTLSTTAPGGSFKGQQINDHGEQMTEKMDLFSYENKTSFSQIKNFTSFINLEALTDISIYSVEIKKWIFSRINDFIRENIESVIDSFFEVKSIVPPSMINERWSQEEFRDFLKHNIIKHSDSYFMWSYQVCDGLFIFPDGRFENYIDSSYGSLLVLISEFYNISLISAAIQTLSILAYKYRDREAIDCLHELELFRTRNLLPDEGYYR